MQIGRRAAALSQSGSHVGSPQQSEGWKQETGFSGERITIDGSDSDSFSQRALVFLLASSALAALLVFALL